MKIRTENTSVSLRGHDFHKLLADSYGLSYEIIFYKNVLIMLSYDEYIWY